MNLILIGLPGVGKTFVGSRLAENLQLTFIDTDELVEGRVGKSCSAIVLEKGLEFFRHVEELVIRELQVEDAVIATGGGSILLESNRLALQSMGKIIYLQADPKIILERKNLKSFQTAEDRLPLYESMADFTLPVEGQSIENLVTTLGGRFGYEFVR